MIRLLHVVPSLEWAGPPSQMALLSGRLRAEGFDVRVFSLRGWGPLAAELTQRGVRVIEFPARRRRSGRSSSGCAKPFWNSLPTYPHLAQRWDRQCGAHPQLASILECGRPRKARTGNAADPARSALLVPPPRTGQAMRRPGHRSQTPAAEGPKDRQWRRAATRGQAMRRWATPAMRQPRAPGRDAAEQCRDRPCGGPPGQANGGVPTTPGQAMQGLAAWAATRGRRCESLNGECSARTGNDANLWGPRQPPRWGSGG